MELDQDQEVTRQVVEKAIAHSEQHVEGVLRNALNLYIGHDKWTFDDLRGRVERERSVMGSDIYSIDGVHLVEFYPLRIT